MIKSRLAGDIARFRLLTLNGLKSRYLITCYLVTSACCLMSFSRWAIVCLLLGLASPAFAEDWFRYRGPRLNGISNETNWSHQWPEAGPTQLWQADVGIGLSAISVSDGRAYTLGNVDDTDRVTCLNTETGAVLWQYDYAAPLDANEFSGGPTSTPTVDGANVYTLSRRGDLFCFDKVTGQLNWQIQVAELAKVRTPTWGFSSSPLVSGELLLLNVGDAGVAINKQTGRLVWSSADRDAGYSSMVPLQVAGQQAVVFGSARSYVCVAAMTGEELWRERWLTTFGCNAADPIVVGEQIFISSGYNRGCALLELKASSVTQLWKNKEMQNQLSSSVLIDGYLYGIHGDVGTDKQLRCMELSSGTVQWSAANLEPGGLSAAGQRLIVLSEAGELVIVDASPAQSQILARHQVLKDKCWTAPVLANGKIYCRSMQGELVCVVVGEEKLVRFHGMD